METPVQIIFIILVAAVLWQTLMFTYLVINTVNQKYHQRKLKMDEKHIRMAFGDDIDAQSLSILVALCALLLSVVLLK